MSPRDDEQDFGAILAAFEAEQAGNPARREPQVGEKVTGTILSIGDESVFVELGSKSEGVIPAAELRDEDGRIEISVGDTIEALVVAVDPGAGTVTLKVRPGQGPAELSELAQAHTHGIPVEGTVVEVVKGGVSVKVGGVNAFCPISQLDTRFVEDAGIYVGEHLTFRITRFEEGRGRGANIVLSRRVLLEEEARERAEELRTRLEVGAVLHGTVTSVTSYGAFVDLGGLEGLLHVSELAHGRVEKAEDVVAPGQELEVQVLKIEPARSDKETERISLSRKALLQDPWQAEAALLRPGSRRQGKVVRLQPFGAFIELAPGIDGLLHVSELGGDRAIRHPREALSVGESVEVTVRSVDLERRRISLALASAEPPSDQPSEWTDSTPGEGFGSMATFFERAKKKE